MPITTTCHFCEKTLSTTPRTIVGTTLHLPTRITITICREPTCTNRWLNWSDSILHPNDLSKLKNASIEKIPPEEYIRRASLWKPGEVFIETLVNGDLNLGKLPGARDLEFLPPSTIKGNLKVPPSLNSLKEIHCRVWGDVCVSKSGLRGFFGGLVSGTFEAEDCLSLRNVSGLFEKDVDLARSGIDSLDQDFECRGSLNVTSCNRLREINSVIGGALIARLSGLKKFGPSCRVGGDVDISHCAKLRHLNNIGSPMDVVARSSGIESVSPRFKCRGDLKISLCRYLESVGGRCGGDASITQSSVRQLRNLTCAGSISAQDCPDLVQILATAGVDLNISECTSLVEISPSCQATGMLKVGPNVSLSKISGHFPSEVRLLGLEKLSEIDASFSCSRNLLIRHCGNLKSVEGKVGGNLLFHGSHAVENISSFCQVMGSLVASGGLSTGDILKVPPKMVFSGKVFKDLRIQHLPIDVVVSPSFSSGGDCSVRNCRSASLAGYVGGAVSVVDTFLKPLAADLEIAGDLSVQRCRGLFRVNCQVGGNTHFETSGIEGTGVAFHAKGKVVFVDCYELKKVTGVFDEGFKIEL